MVKVFIFMPSPYILFITIYYCNRKENAYGKKDEGYTTKIIKSSIKN